MLNKDALAQRLDAAAAAGLIQPAQVAPLADFLARDDSAPQAAVSATISGEGCQAKRVSPSPSGRAPN